MLTCFGAPWLTGLKSTRLWKQVIQKLSTVIVVKLALTFSYISGVRYLKLILPLDIDACLQVCKQQGMPDLLIEADGHKQSAAKFTMCWSLQSFWRYGSLCAVFSLCIQIVTKHNDTWALCLQGSNSCAYCRLHLLYASESKSVQLFLDGLQCTCSMLWSCLVGGAHKSGAEHQEDRRSW